MDIKEHKKTFQLERLILFSDAVFAIAITLLVIELKLPELDELTEDSLQQSLRDAFPHFFSFVMSFMIIGIYWMSHHRMFYYVTDYNRRLIWMNLFFLFFIALMPFSSNVFGVYSGLNTAFLVYVFNISMLALFNYMLYGYISRPDKKLSHGLDNRRLVKYFQARSWVVPLCFGIGVLITLTAKSPWMLAFSRMTPILIIPGMRIIRWKYKDVAP